jgi:hypothetical protein
VEERQEAAINGRRSQNSERVRAHLHERGFRQEPDRRVLVGEVDRGLTSRHRRRAPQGHGRSAVPPDDSDMHPGRERPPPDGTWGEEGGSEMGVAHAPVVSLPGCDSGAGLGSRRHRAPPAPDPKPQPGKSIEHRASCAKASTPGVSRAKLRVTTGGTVLPSFGSPTQFPRSRVQTAATREGEGGCVTVRRTSATADPGTGGEAAL